MFLNYYLKTKITFVLKYELRSYYIIIPYDNIME